MLSNRLLDEFRLLGFTDNEAKIYLELLKTPKQNGSQLAKDLGITRPSAYLALDKLYKKGAVYYVSGNSKEYIAKSPEILFTELKKKFNHASDNLTEDLKNLAIETKADVFYNIEGTDNVFQKVKELIRSAKTEVYINTNLPLSHFKRAIAASLRKNVRVIVFSFYPVNDIDLPVELYQKPQSKKPQLNDPKAITVVKDYETALIAGMEDKADFAGTFSNNRLFVKMISQYIHFDIYLMKFEEKYSLDWSTIELLNTLKEKYDL